MRHGYALETRSHWASQTGSRKEWICAGYAPATFLARHLDPAGTRAGSCWNQSGARVCVRGMRLSSHALNLAKVPLDKKQICAGYALATLLARHLDPRRAPPRSCQDACFIKKSMRRGYAPYIYIRRVNLFGSYAPAYAPYIYIYAKNSIAAQPLLYFQHHDFSKSPYRYRYRY